MPISNVTMLTTFSEQAGRINQLIVQGEQLLASDIVIFDKANVSYISANNAANNRANSANSFAVTIGASSNGWANTITNALYPYANGVANSANAYAVTVGGAAGNAWSNTLYSAGLAHANGTANAANSFATSSISGAYPFANGVANSANAFAVTIGASSNGWSNTITNALYPYANSRANSSNSFAVTIGASSNGWSNTVSGALYPYANGVANSANAFAVTIGASSNNYANNTFYKIANGAAAFGHANAAYNKANSITGITGPKGITIITPVANDSFTILFTNTALTLKEVRSIVRGTGATVAANIYYGTDRSSGTRFVSGGINTSSQTTGNSTLTFDNNSMSGNSFIWIVIDTITGSVNEFHATLLFTT